MTVTQKFKSYKEKDIQRDIEESWQERNVNKISEKKKIEGCCEAKLWYNRKEHCIGNKETWHLMEKVPKYLVML